MTRDDTCKGEVTRVNKACKSKSPKYPYIRGLNRRGPNEVN